MTVGQVYKSHTPRTDSIWNANSDTEGTPTNIMHIYDEMRKMEFENIDLRNRIMELEELLYEYVMMGRSITNDVVGSNPTSATNLLTNSDIIME